MEPDTRQCYIVKDSPSIEGEPSSASSITQKNITFTPGLFKIYDEILVNAADNCKSRLFFYGSLLLYCF